MKKLVPFLSLLLLWPALTLAQVTPGKITPEKVIALFDSFAPVIMLGIGFAVTRWPALKRVPNDAIPWINAALYIVGKLAVGTANAGALGAVGGVLGFAGTAAYSVFMSTLMSAIYDKFLKPTLDAKVPRPR
jgi:hypothetical protein